MFVVSKINQIINRLLSESTSRFCTWFHITPVADSGFPRERGRKPHRDASADLLFGVILPKTT